MSPCAACASCRPPARRRTSATSKDFGNSLRPSFPRFQDSHLRASKSEMSCREFVPFSEDMSWIYDTELDFSVELASERNEFVSSVEKKSQIRSIEKNQFPCSCCYIESTSELLSCPLED